MGRRSLTRSVARAAVVGNVAGRAAASGANAANAKAAAAAPPPSEAAAPAPAGGLTPEKLEMLKQVAELKASGVLSEAEFEVEKAKILHG